MFQRIFSQQWGPFCTYYLTGETITIQSIINLVVNLNYWLALCQKKYHDHFLLPDLTVSTATAIFFWNICLLKRVRFKKSSNCLMLKTSIVIRHSLNIFYLFFSSWNSKNKSNKRFMYNLPFAQTFFVPQFWMGKCLQDKCIEVARFFKILDCIKILDIKFIVTLDKRHSRSSLS